MRIASLLPSATEILCALDLHAELIGVSHECDYPDSIHGKPILTHSRIDSAKTSAQINAEVKQALSAGLSLYAVETERLQQLKPSLIVTQDTCQVCAVAADDVQAAASQLFGSDCAIVALSPRSLDDIFAGMLQVGEAAGVAEKAHQVVAGLRQRLRDLEAMLKGCARPRVLFLEWFEPPMPAGHWTPELLRLAGAQVVLPCDGQPTTSISWESIAAADPDCIIVAPCGFDLRRNCAEARILATHRLWCQLRAVREDRVYFCDGNAYFNRPGPRIVESAELVAAILHGDRVPMSFAHGGFWRWSEVVENNI